MKNLLKKKIPLFSTGDYVTYLNYNRVEMFQMDIFRNNITDLQIIYNNMDYGNSNLDFKSNKIIFVLSFSKELKSCNRCFENFKSSTFFKETILLEDLNFKDRYIIKIDKNWDMLYKTISMILYDIYEYSEKDFYSVRFLDFTNGKPILIKYTHVSWYDYLFKRN